jgi:hypothetical protein
MKILLIKIEIITFLHIDGCDKKLFIWYKCHNKNIFMVTTWDIILRHCAELCVVFSYLVECSLSNGTFIFSTRKQKNCFTKKVRGQWNEHFPLKMYSLICQGYLRLFLDYVDAYQRKDRAVVAERSSELTNHSLDCSR